jgi:hypothetical protein
MNKASAASRILFLVGAGLRRADRARFGLRLLHWISGRPPGGNPLAANSVKRLFECYRPAGDAVNGGSRPGA